MTKEVVLLLRDSTDTTTLVEVELTDNDIHTSHKYNNPLIAVPTPVAATPVGGSTPALGANIKAINIGFFTNRFLLTFTLVDGLGSLDFGGSGTTKYEKMVYMTNSQRTLNPKVLRINGREFHGMVEGFTFNFAAGDGDLALNCSLSFIATDNIIMVD